MIEKPVLLLHGVWLEEYQGLEPDPPFYAGGFKYPKTHGTAHEVLNFSPLNGKNYGFVQHHRKDGTPKRIDLQKNLGAPKGATYVDDVLVVWTAPQRNRKGRTIIGWYDRARVHELPQDPPIRRGRTIGGELIQYRVEAEATDCRLLKPHERVCVIPPRTKKSPKGHPGQSNIFYPQNHSELHSKAILDAIEALLQGKPPPPIAKRIDKSKGKIDQERRERVENAAIEAVWEYYELLGYEIDDRQKIHGIGYDLRATNADIELCIEVKGRSGPIPEADFSPNENDAIKAFERNKFHDGIYRICIVTNAEHQRRKIHHFDYISPLSRGKKGFWFDSVNKIRLREVVRNALRLTPVKNK